MPLLKNARHEHFAQLVAGGKDQTDAYVAAGFSKNGAAPSACRLLRDANVCSRIAELRKAVEEPARERAIEKAAVSKAWVLDKLTKVVDMGMAIGTVTGPDGETGELKAANLPAANTALSLIGKELGMFIERREVRTGELDALPHDELKQIRDALLEFSQAGMAAEPVTGSEGRATH
jgi:phage terminase small subunit